MGDALDAHAIAYDYADLYAPPTSPVPPVNEADALILMGGSMSANDNLPFITREIEYIRGAVSGVRAPRGLRTSWFAMEPR